MNKNKGVLLILLLMTSMCFSANAKIRELYHIETEQIIGACSKLDRGDIKIEYCVVSYDGVRQHIFKFITSTKTVESAIPPDLGSRFTIKNISSGVKLDLGFDDKTTREMGRYRQDTFYWIVPSVFVKVFSEKFDARFTLYVDGEPVEILLNDQEKQECVFISRFE